MYFMKIPGGSLMRMCVKCCHKRQKGEGEGKLIYTRGGGESNNRLSTKTSSSSLSRMNQMSVEAGMNPKVG